MANTVDEIRRKLEGESHNDYLQALKELSSLTQKDATELLLSIANSHTGRVQARILNPLREIDPKLADKLAVQIISDEHSHFITDALYSLWETNSSDGLDIAARLLLTSSDSIVRIWCATYLGACGNRGHVLALEQALDDRGVDEEGREVRSAARAAIAQITERNEASS